MSEFNFRFQYRPYYRRFRACDCASAYWTLSKFDHPLNSYNVMLIFLDVGHSVANLVLVLDFLMLPIKEGWLLTTFLWDILIYSWDTTTSISWKQMAAILEFYLWCRFSFLAFSRHWHVILHRATKLDHWWKSLQRFELVARSSKTKTVLDNEKVTLGKKSPYEPICTRNITRRLASLT